MDFDGKKFKSVSEADFSLESETEKKELEEKSEELKDVLAEIKANLGEKVKDVKLTAKLVSYPVCLTAVGDISIEMEKVFNSMPNADGKMKAEKVLEISSTHKVIETLKALYDSDKEKLKKYSIVLYEQARLLEGLSIDSVTEFVTAISDII